MNSFTYTSNKLIGKNYRSWEFVTLNIAKLSVKNYHLNLLCFRNIPAIYLIWMQFNLLTSLSIRNL